MNNLHRCLLQVDLEWCRSGLNSKAGTALSIMKAISRWAVMVKRASKERSVLGFVALREVRVVELSTSGMGHEFEYATKRFIIDFDSFIYPSPLQCMEIWFSKS
jgi:hypothetical protein